MDEGTVSNGKEEQQLTPIVSTSVAVPAAPVQRHEVEPTVPYAIVPGPARDTFLFYHIDATAKDVNGLWDYCRFCISNLVWVNDHFVVTPNPLYLVASSDLEERHAKIKRVLLNWYRAKRLVGDLKLSFD
ncbi:MAG TPA: hypothetical protein VHN78_09485 [Chloroflexota bacterium]|nr:hypothetical protein [Chloroflexota bacterium]